MWLLIRRQKLCRQERKIIKAHYMLAYECGLRRLRSGRVAHRLSDYNRHIAYDQCLSMYFYHYKSSAVFLITSKKHLYFKEHFRKVSLPWEGLIMFVLPNTIRSLCSASIFLRIGLYKSFPCSFASRCVFPFARITLHNLFPFV